MPRTYDADHDTIRKLQRRTRDPALYAAIVRLSTGDATAADVRALEPVAKSAELRWIDRFPEVYAPEVGRLSEGQRVRRELEARSKLEEKERARQLRGEIRQGKAYRKEALATARAACATDAERNRRAALELRERTKLDRRRCVDSKQVIRNSAALQIDPARSELAEALERRRTERRWKGETSSKARATARRDTREESDDRVRSELPAELQPVWDRHKRRFAEGEHRSRLEAFQEWAAEHRADVDAEIQRDLESSIDRLLESEGSYYEDREAAEGIGGVRERMAARDLESSLRVSDARKAENAAARARAKGNPELHAALLEQARRRGHSDVDWASYFRNAGIEGVGMATADAAGKRARSMVYLHTINSLPEAPASIGLPQLSAAVRALEPRARPDEIRSALDEQIRQGLVLELKPGRFRQASKDEWHARRGRSSAREGIGAIQMSDHHVTIEPDRDAPGLFKVQNQSGHVFLHAASLESARATAADLRASYRYEIHDHSGREDPRGAGAVLLEWGAAPNVREGHGWLPQLWENGRQALDTYAARGLDSESDAMAMAERLARERVDRYSGDWMITLRRRPR